MSEKVSIPSQVVAPPSQQASLSPKFHDVQDQANRLYRGKALAPMVRASTTPLRTLALEYGADIVYTEELVDRSLSQTIRQMNARLGTIDYVKDISMLSPKVQRKLAREGRPCLMVRIDPKLEANKVICQLGTGEPDLALQAAQHVYKDFAAIDINMGCPKKFSVSGGMGSALLNDAPRAGRIISTLREHIPRPISCKIRLLSTADATIDFVRQMITAGANAVAIHARTVGQDDVKPADWKTLETVMKRLTQEYPTFPFLLNGDFYDRQEMEDMIHKTRASGVMLGRPALYNTSIFRPLSEPLQDKKVVAQLYLQHSARYEQHFKNAKYVLCEMINSRRTPTPRVPFLEFGVDGGITIAKTCSCTKIEQVFEVWGVEWKGLGLPALGIDVSKVQEHGGEGAADDVASESVLEPGEHRYDDSYFLIKQGRRNDEEEDVTKSKRIKIDKDEEKKE
jgi:tRNA-dihydrouridine synthase 2